MNPTCPRASLSPNGGAASLKRLGGRVIIALAVLWPAACGGSGQSPTADGGDARGPDGVTSTGGAGHSGNTGGAGSGLRDGPGGADGHGQGGAMGGTGGAASGFAGGGGGSSAGRAGIGGGGSGGQGGLAGEGSVGRGGRGGTPTSACAQAPVSLGAAAAFVVLAGSTVTNAGPTSITGDLGVSPGTAVTGFPPGMLVGAEHAGDSAAALAEAALTIAYNDAAGRTLCPITIAGNLGGQTLAPGLYKSTSSLEISSGDLTLDAQGDPTAVFIFQMASTLTTTAGRHVILGGGAKSANVFWQVGTSATLGSTSSVQGTVMADQAITMNTGATLNGRVLARVAAVAMDSVMIVEPAP